MGGKGKRGAPAAIWAADPAPSKAEKPLDVARQAITESLVSLRSRIRAVALELEQPGEMDGEVKMDRDRVTRDKASHLAWLTKQVAQIGGELRKLEAHENKGARDLDPQLVTAWLRQLSGPEWSNLRREIDAHFAGGSVLA